jgi:hypothetical protein
MFGHKKKVCFADLSFSKMLSAVGRNLKIIPTEKERGVCVWWS